MTKLRTRTPVVERASRMSVGIVLAVLALSVMAREAVSDAGPALLAVAAIAGLPHGAADVTLLRAGLRSLLLYAAAAAAALALTFAFPGPALIVLLALSVAHFAEGEQAFDRLRGGRGRLFPALAVGWCTVGLLMAAHPVEVRPLLSTLSRPVADAALSPVGRSVLLAGSALFLLAAVLPAWRGDAADRRTAADVVLVAVLFTVAPPLVAFAVWFAGWHAVRHTARLLVERPDVRLADLARRTAAPSVVAAAGLAALIGTAGGLPPALVLGLLALTVPHAVVVVRQLRPAG